jgi:hypothetical protein
MGLGLSLLTVSAGLALWRRELPQSVSSPQAVGSGSSPSRPSKEYIYVGGKLVATEEPDATPSPTPSGVPAPSNIIATATFSSPSTPLVLIEWAPSAGTVDHYRIERTQSKDAPFVAFKTAPGFVATSFRDTTVGLNVTYLYRVCAVDAAGRLSAYSNVDLATTTYMQDDPLTLRQTPLRAQHFLDLMQAVNAVRATAGLPAAPWSAANPVPKAGGAIYASHLNDLRASLGEALFAMGALGFVRPQYEFPDPMVKAQSVRAVHVQQLRDLVR